MSRTALLLSALLFPSIATAVEPGESNDEVVLFEGDESLFNGTEEAYGLDLWDEGVGIYAKADVSSRLSFIMEGRSELAWPEILENSWDQTERGGEFVLDNSGRVWIEITGEIFGVKLGYTVWEEQVRWKETFTPTSLILEGTRQGKSLNLTAKGESLFDFEEPFDVIEDSLRITVAGTVKPILDTRIDALAIEVEDGAVNSTDATVLVEPPDTNDGEVRFESRWVGDIAGDMGFEFAPTVTVEVGSLSVGPLTYPLTLDLFSDTKSLESDWVEVAHDLPAIEPGAATIDFGQVTLGESVTRQFTVLNNGNVVLEGLATVDGDAYVMADAPLLLPATNDGPSTEQELDIDFLPTTEGEFSGTLTIITNDPVQPEITVAMFGVGVAPPDGGDDGNGDPNGPGDGDVITQPGSGCGCNSTTPVGGFALLGLGFIGLVARRRSRKA